VELLRSSVLRRIETGLVVMATTAAIVAAAAAAPRGEYEVKAAFLINFASLVEWPSKALKEGEELRVGIVGDGDYVDEVMARLDGRSVRTRVVRAGRLESLDQLKGLHMVYVTESAPLAPEEVQAAAGGRSVLLIGEEPGFAERGGMINFFTEKKKIRFEVNPTAAQGAGLKVSSRLLSVARVVD
jgi:hypothetical protein